ncbi:minor capsid protein [Tissierella pigra]|uniref:Phage head morphogenesis protein n=1 Tax=Tissierella pigra TaxID=2607614 RepID=A0A6N7XH82_9FIRM|nr:minor capsid protein [Tissierella pigra]MSU01401.1 phage head morphogenesis protein [Tissierella pigra]
MFKQLEKEILKLRIAIEKETNKDIKRILLEQKKHLERVRRDIGSIYMKYADSEGKLVINSLDRFNILREMEKNIINMSRELIKKTTNITDEALLRSYVDGYYKTAHIINNGSSVGINYKLLRPEFIESVLRANFEGMTYSDRIWKNTNNLYSKLYDIIGKGITDGTSIQKLSKEVKNAFGTSSFEAHRLVRNELSRVVSQAQDQIYHDSGVVQELMFVATLDDRISETCQGLDGNRYKLTDNYPKIPEDTHIMCRSCYVPIVSGDWNPRTRRDNITKENIPYTKYEDWAEQNNIS